MRRNQLISLFLWFSTVSFVFLSGVDEDFLDSYEERDFVPLSASSAGATAATSITSVTPTNSVDDILMDEVTSLSLNCEKSLGVAEEAFKSFVMKSLDFSSEETFADLERPSCRAFFDRNAHYLSKEQLAKLLSTERGRRILYEGEALEFFSDFSDFTLADFDQFPALQVGKIRNLFSISSEILLKLVKQRGFINAGRLERIPITFGERVFDHEMWKIDSEIWQLFTVEGILQIKTVPILEKFAKFLADSGKFKNLLYKIVESDDLASSSNGSSLSSSQNQRNPLASTLICKSIAKHSNLLTRWAVQMEEFLIFLMEISDNLNETQIISIGNACSELMKTRQWLRDEVKNRCEGVSDLSQNENLSINSLTVILDSALTWRFRESLKFLINHPNNSRNAAVDANSTPMTLFLLSRLSRFPRVVDFYRNSGNLFSVSNDLLLTHFVFVNEISDLAAIFELKTEDPVEVSNEKLVLSISIRRILLSLLSPSQSCSEIIQEALNYVFTPQSDLLATSDSTEILRWFRQAQDLQTIPVLDRLIRTFGHEFDVSREIRAMLDNNEMRMKLFTEAQSSLVKLIAALANGLSDLLIEEAPRIFISPSLDVKNALLMDQVDPLPARPDRSYTEEELKEHALKVGTVREHNNYISEFLQTSLRLLKTFEIDANAELSANFAGFIQPNFRIQFQDKVGFDAGGLRRTWLSALLRVFGDEKRMLFPMLMADGGRVPAALLDPEIMGHLGALHGKSLQSGVKPDWFFSPRFTLPLLFAPELPEMDELHQLVEELYPEIYQSFENILNAADIGEDPVDYFNDTKFPTIEWLTEDEILETVAADVTTGSAGVAAVIDNSLLTTEVTPTPSNSLDNTQPQPQPLQIIIPQNDRSVDSDDDSDYNESVSSDSVSSVNTHEDAHGEVDVANTLDLNQQSTTAASATSSNPTASPPRHSFSRMLAFDTRFFPQKSIFSGPSLHITSILEIHQYRTSLTSLLALNLLRGVKSYWRSFNIFFDARYRTLMTPEFLHELLEPPVVMIEDILKKIQFHRSCETILLIDDDDVEEGDCGNGEDSNESSPCAEADCDDSAGTPNKKPCLSFASSNVKQVKNITARQALIRILSSSSFTSQSSIQSLLSFSTGCPQIPPAGLDALRLSVHCYPSTTPATKLSKSHTCMNLIDFFSSVNYKETKEAFLESVMSSSGFGFA